MRRARSALQTTRDVDRFRLSAIGVAGFRFVVGGDKSFTAMTFKVVQVFTAKLTLLACGQFSDLPDTDRDS